MAKHVFVRSLLTGADAPATVSVNGRSFTIPNGGEAVPMPKEFEEAARHSNLPLSFVDDEAEGDAPVAGAVGGGVGGSSPAPNVPVTFDASTVVTGTVAEVSAQLGDLSDEQLDAIEAAEKAGQNRAGVLKAVSDARDAMKAGE